MLKLNATSKADDFLNIAADVHPQIHEVLREANRLVSHHPQSILDYQAALLYLFAAQYNKETIVELGTKQGYSAAILAMAAPDARIFTVDKDPVMVAAARANLSDFANVTVIKAYSWNFANSANDGKIGLVFVDADHQQVKRDLAWWPKLKPDGLMLFHDYSPEFPKVVHQVDNLAGSQRAGARPDIVCFDDNNHGMAGIYKTS